MPSSKTKMEADRKWAAVQKEAVEKMAEENGRSEEGERREGATEDGKRGMTQE